MTDRDPAVEQWRHATQKSTGALLREALDANEQLAAEHAKACAEVERLREALRRANDAGLKLIRERDQALADVERLTARIDRQRGGYVLTDKGRAALTRPEEKPHG